MAFRKTSNKQRNVIVLGKAGCGKSTLANKIIHQDDVFTVVDAYRVDTEDKAKFGHVKENVSIDGQVYAINVIDTIGFQDRDGKSDSEIIKELKRQMKIRAPGGVSLIIFVLRNGRFKSEESAVFKTITDNFSEVINKISLLVITGCDGKSDEERRNIVEDFKVNSYTKDAADIMEKGIYCVGLPNINNLSEEIKQDTMDKMKSDMIPIHRVIAEAERLYLQDEIQKDSVCTIQ